MESSKVIGSVGSGSSSLPSVSQLLSDYGEAAVRAAVKHPEVLVAVGLAFLAYKRVPAVRRVVDGARASVRVESVRVDSIHRPGAT